MKRRTLLAAPLSTLLACHRTTAIPSLTFFTGDNYSLLRQDFNEAAGQSRVLTLLSPT